MSSGIMKSCTKCGKNMDQDNFYQYRDGHKHELCKKCLTLFVDNFDQDSYLWILEEFDVPYIPEVWNELLQKALTKYGGDRSKLNGQSVIGKYLGSMRLKQHKDDRWADTERFVKEYEERKQKALEENPELSTREADLKAALEAGDITEAEYKTFMATEVLYAENEDMMSPFSGFDPVTGPGGFNNFDERQFCTAEELQLPNPADDLTLEDKKYLAMKWGMTYRPDEWVTLEIDWAKMSESFDIQDADTENVLIQLCKTNLKCNQALDSGDIDGYQKLARVQESLRKSAKFTKAQKKEEETNFVDCVGSLVAYCEKEGHKIPRMKIEVEQDIVDKVINDLKGYNRDLIYEDKALSRQIEDYLNNRAAADQKKRDEAEAKAKGLEYVELNDEDYKEHFNRLEEEKYMDEEGDE